MAGGTWTSQNKRRPGAYINTQGVAQDRPTTSIGRTLLIGSANLNWGAKGVIELNAESDIKALLGTTLANPRLAALKETMKSALTVLYLNNNDGAKATVAEATLPWNFTAKYAGTVGNNITVNVEKDATDPTLITVTTVFGTTVVDSQTVRTITARGLKGNAYIDVAFTGDNTEPTPVVTPVEGGADFSATAGKAKLEALTATTSYQLAGGTTVPAEVTDLLEEAMANEDYQVVTTAGTAPDSDLHALVATATKRLREKEGYKIRAVVPLLEGSDGFDYEGVTAVRNGVELTDGTALDTTTATGWFAGRASAAAINESLTYAEYPGATAANPKLTNEQTIDALNAGQVVFTTRRNGTAVVEQDINTLVSFTDEKPKDYQKNRVIRTLDGIAMDTAESFESQFIGKVDNDPTGRDLFKANRVAYLRNLSDIHAILDFDPADLTVDAGEDKDAVVVTLNIQPVDAMEKLYMTVYVS